MGWGIYYSYISTWKIRNFSWVLEEKNFKWETRSLKTMSIIINMKTWKYGILVKDQIKKLKQKTCKMQWLKQGCNLLFSCKSQDR